MTMQPETESLHDPFAFRIQVNHVTKLLPGLLLSTVIAIIAYALRLLPTVSILSPLILAIIIGMIFHNVIGTPQLAKPGIKFSLRRILRLGIILLGLQLTISQVIAVGGAGILVITTTLVATFIFTIWLGRMLKVDRKLSELIAAGTSVCGASAVIATNTVTGGKDEDVAYAIACVTVFGTFSMLLYPLAAGFFGMGNHAFGLWAGSSIHEVAQVVAAAYQRGTQAGQLGTIAKLTRVMMLAPMVLALKAVTVRRYRRSDRGTMQNTPTVPWFVLGFIAMVAVASSGWVPLSITHPAAAVTKFLLTVALASMGLETDIRKLAGEGIRPALLGAGAWVFISLFSLALIRMTTLV